MRKINPIGLLFWSGIALMAYLSYGLWAVASVMIGAAIFSGVAK